MAGGVGQPALEAKGRYAVGTLTYTKAGLFVLFGWLLWGDFCFSLMEKVLPAIYPIFLIDKLGASNKAVSMLMVTIPEAMIVALCPPISFRSDRTRSRWGRRIPYMTITAPFLCLFLVGLGYSEQIAAFLRVSSLPGWLHVSPHVAVIGVLGLLLVLFNFFNSFVQSVYWYLFADVVPREFLGRFLGLFRMVGFLAEWVFQTYIFPYAGTHMHYIFLGASVLYFVGFGLMCWRVKEGEYPPVENPEADKSIVAQARMYFKDCYTHPIYVLAFLHSSGVALVQAGIVANMVFVLSLPGVTYEKAGTVLGHIALATMCLTYLGGWISDRFHPLRTQLAMLVLLVPAQFASFFYMRDYSSFVLWTWVGRVPLVLFSAAAIPLHISLFPREKYGQFGSANAMLRSFLAVIGGAVSGLFLDRMTGNGQIKDALRWMYVWSGFWYFMTLLCMIGVYVCWKRRGGNGDVYTAGVHAGTGATGAGAIAGGERRGSGVSGTES